MDFPEQLYLSNSLDKPGVQYVRGDIVEGIRQQKRDAEATVAKLPKCWRLKDGELVQDKPVVLGMEVWCKPDVHPVSFLVYTINPLFCGDADRVYMRHADVYDTLEAAEAKAVKDGQSDS